MARTVLLVGAGHANLHVATHAHSLIERNARVVLIDPGNFWYSGMATGMLGGRYSADEDQLDPQALIRASGGEFISGQVTSVNTAKQCVQLASGENCKYD